MTEAEAAAVQSGHDSEPRASDDLVITEHSVETEPSRIAQSRHIGEFVAWATGAPQPATGLRHRSTDGPSQ